MSATHPGILSVLFWFINGLVLASLVMYLLVGHKILLKQPIFSSGPTPPNRVCWGLGTLVIVLLTTVVLGTIVRGLFEVSRSRLTVVESHLGITDGRETLSSTDQIVLNAFVFLGLLLVVPPLVGTLVGIKFSDFGLSIEGAWKDLKIGTAAFFLVTPVVQLVFILAVKVLPPKKHPLEEMLRSQDLTWQIILLAYLTSMILATIVEELVFRGLLQGWLRRLYRRRPSSEASGEIEVVRVPFWIPRPLLVWTRWCSRSAASRVMPVLVTSFLFAAIHYPQMPAPFAIFVLALALGFLFERTQRLLPSIVLHSFFNGVNTTVLLIQLLSPPPMNARNHKESTVPQTGRNRVETPGFSLARETLTVRFLEGRGSGWSSGPLAIAD